VPSFVAFIVATLVAWSVRGTMPAPAGHVLPSLIALLFWIVAFWFVRRWLSELRPH
jgi:hypothetical protein